MRSAARVAMIVTVALTTAGCGTGARPVLVGSGDGEPAGGTASRSTVVVEVETDTPDQDRTDPDASSADEAAADASASLDAVSTVAPTSEPPLVVYDTDMGPDIDDVLALAMLHAYEKRGMVELAAVTVSRDTTLGARFADAVNTFYGRPDIPIGVYRGPVKAYDERRSFVNLADRWPNDVADGPLPDGYRVQRRVLADAAASDRTVLFVQTGFSGNLAALLGSGPDELADRSGRELVADHATMLSIMAGATGGFVEFNVEYDVTSARTVIEGWPGLLVQSPWELGNGILYPYSSIRDDLTWVERHPVREAYEHADLDWHRDAPPYYDMRAWDLTSVLYAVEPDAGYFVVSGPGTVTIDESGRTGFRSDGGPHLQLGDAGGHSEAQRAVVVDRMIELVSDRP